MGEVYDAEVKLTRIFSYISSYRCFTYCETPVFDLSGSNTVYGERYAKEKIHKIPSLQIFYPDTVLFVSKSTAATL